MRSSFSMFLLYHAYVYLEFLILACTIYILAPAFRKGGMEEMVLKAHKEIAKYYFKQEF